MLYYVCKINKAVARQRKGVADDISHIDKPFDAGGHDRAGSGEPVSGLLLE